MSVGDAHVGDGGGRDVLTGLGGGDDLVPGVPDMAWRQVSVTSNECLGATRCPHGEECFAELARERTKDVDIVVTNHALLAIDALADVAVLPEHDAVIIDEAHELDGRITSVATSEISARALAMAAQVEKQSPTSVTACKRLINGARHQPPQQVLVAEREAFVALFDSQDQREGVNAFLNKRKPEWRNA